MDEYIPSKQSIPHAKALILRRITLEENCIEKPFDTGEIYALQKAALVMDAYEQGYLVERKKGKWKWYNCVWVCSCCGKNPTKGTGYVQSKEQLFPVCPYCGADMRGET